jgi:HK97 family phage major capsid protein
MQKIMRDIRILAELYRPDWAAMSESIERSGVPTMHVAPPKLREKVKKLEGDIAELREKRAPLQKTLDDAIEAYAGKGVTEDSTEFNEAREARKAVGEVDDQINEKQQQLNGTLELVGPSSEGQPDKGRRTAAEVGDAIWDSTGLLEDEEMAAQLAAAAVSKAHLGQIPLGEALSREGVIASFGVGDAQATSEEPVEPLSIQRRGQFRGILPQLRQALTVLGLVPKGTMELNTFEYAREEGPLTGDAAVVKEGTKKPQGSFSFVPASAKAETVAEFMKLKKQQLEDVPALRSAIDGRLRYLLERELERQILVGKGPGVSPELEGVLPVSGKGVVKYSSAEIDADQVLSGITTVLLANAVADAIVMNPLDWEKVLKAKARFGTGETAGGSGEYYGGGPFSVTPQTMWGVSLVPAMAMPQGRPLVGDYSIGLQLLIRTGISVLLSDADGTDFTDNMVTMLAELRAANVIWRPSAFAEVFLSKAAEEAAEAE